MKICHSDLQKAIISAPQNWLKSAPRKVLLKTASGSIYKVVGLGGKASIDYRDLELLRNGFSPEQIHALKTATKQY